MTPPWSRPIWIYLRELERQNIRISISHVLAADANALCNGDDGSLQSLPITHPRSFPEKRSVDALLLAANLNLKTQRGAQTLFYVCKANEFLSIFVRTGDKCFVKKDSGNSLRLLIRAILGIRERTRRHWQSKPVLVFDSAIVIRLRITRIQWLIETNGNRKAREVTNCLALNTRKRTNDWDNHWKTAFSVSVCQMCHTWWSYWQRQRLLSWPSLVSHWSGTVRHRSRQWSPTLFPVGPLDETRTVLFVLK